MKFEMTVTAIALLLIASPPARADMPLCSDGQRSYFGVCPDGKPPQMAPVPQAPPPTTGPASNAPYDQAWAQLRQENYAAALPLFQQSATQGNAHAAFILGTMYNQALGVSLNEVQAVYWFRKAADAADIMAEYNLGIYFENGEGNLAKDDTQAAYWYRKSADGGLQYGMYAIGLEYYFGRGIAKDDVQAAYWFSKAAGLGHSDSMKMLAAFYKNGLGGLPKDDVAAAAWAAKAAALDEK
jgi:TPR repeat protein